MRTKTSDIYYINNLYKCCKSLRRLHRILQRKRRKHKKFSKQIGRKCRFVQTRIEENNDHARIMRKLQFRGFINPLMLGGNKKFTPTPTPKQTCSFQSQVCLNMCELFVTTRH